MLSITSRASLRGSMFARRTFAALLFCSASLFCHAHALGQAATGNITGSVSDAAGARLPNATVTVAQDQTSLVRTVETNDDGEFAVNVLPIGAYTITAELSGFKRKVVSGIELRVDQTANIEVALETGDVSETVQITDAAPLLDTERSGVGQVIENETIVNLPLNGRNPFALGQLSGNAVVVTGLANTGNGSPPPFVAGGARYTANDFLLDGVDNNTFLKNIAYTSSVDAIEEFKVQTNGFSAEFGRASGAVVNATIRGGTNRFSGTLFEFLRNDKLDANNFFRNATPLTAAQVAQGLTKQPRAPFKQNQFGGAIGGPVYLPRFGEGGPALYNGRDRTFFFFDYQGTRNRAAGVGSFADVPTAAIRRGDFSNYRDPQGRLIPIYDPATRRIGPNGQVIADPFPGNIIPANRINPSVAAVIGLIPDPNSTITTAGGIGGRFLATRPRGFDNDQFDIRIDQTLRGSDRLTGRYSYFNGANFAPGTFEGALDSGSTGQNKTQNGVLSLTSLFGASVVNEARFGATRFDGGSIANNTGQIAEGFARFPFPVQGFPQIIFAANRSGAQQFSSLAGSGFNAVIENRFQYSDNVTISAGNHSIKTGADVRRYQYNSNAGNFGSFFFGQTYTGITSVPNSGAQFADFLLGLPSFIEGAQQLDFSRLRQTLFGAFVQDDWKATPKLTLNLGVRYDIYKQPTDARNVGGFFDARTGRIARPGQGGYSRAILKEDYNNVSPRAGLAYQLNDRTVLRAAYGVFITDQERNPQSNVLGAQAPNIPVFAVPTVTESATVAPAFTISTPIQTRPFDVNFSSFSPTSPLAITLFAPDFENFVSPYVQQYNASIQYEPRRNYVVELSYLGSKGTKLGNRVNLNQVPVEVANTTNIATPQLNRRFPYINGLIAFDSATGTSNYNSVNLRVERRFTNGFGLLGNYTFSKSIEFGVPGFVGTFAQNGGTALPLDSYNLEREVAVSSLDIPHRVVISGIYELPFGRGRRFLSDGILGKILGGFQFNGLYSARSGYPTDIRFGTPPARTFATQNVPDLVAGQSIYNPNWRDDPTLQYFNPAAFAAPPANRFGNLGKRPARGPGSGNLDFSVLRNFRFAERYNVQFRAEAFNLTNTPQFGLAAANTPSLIIGNPNFGRIVTVSDVGRQIQFGLKFLF